MTQKLEMIYNNVEVCIGFDLDGTLLNNGEWKPGVKTLVNKLSLKYPIFCATGRSILECNEIVNELNIAYLICDDGQYVYDLKKGNYAIGEYINICESDYDFFIKNRIDIAVETERYIYTESKILKKLLKIFCEVQESVILQGTPRNYENIYKIYYYEKIEDSIIGLEKRYSITKIEKKFGSLKSRDVNKYTGFKKIFKNSRIKIDNTLYFGDGKNDIELMNAVKIGIAVYNANEELKEVSKYTLKDEEELLQILLSMCEN